MRLLETLYFQASNPWEQWVFAFIYLFIFVFCLFRAMPMTEGGSQLGVELEL